MAENKEGEKTDIAFIVFNEYALNLEDVNYNGDQVYYEVEFAFSNPDLRFNEIGFKMFRKQLIECTEGVH